MAEQWDIDKALWISEGSRTVGFRFNLLDKNDNYLRFLDNVETASVSYNSFNTIKRTASFRIRDDANNPINYLSDKISVYARIKVTDDTINEERVLLEGEWQEYLLGIFILSSPKRQEQGKSVIREVEAYDSTVILVEDKFSERYTIKSGTNYVQAAIQILRDSGIRKYKIQETSKVLSRDLEYEPGTEKIQAIQDLLNAINYTPIHVDPYGYFVSRPYINPNDAPISHYYTEGEWSVIANGVEEELDLYSIPNRWVAYYSNVDGENELSYTSIYTNENLSSPTSTVNRGRTIVDYRKVEEIADQESLDSYVTRIASESSQVFGKVRFQTALMPTHDYANVIFLENTTLGIADRYSETSWKIECKPGALMTHEARKVVRI